MISDKQKLILAFPYSDYDALICDGAIRSGKTSIMFLAYVDWAMDNFNGKRFIVIGKSVGSAIRNVIEPYTNLYYATRKYKLKRSGTRLIVQKGDKYNFFDVFGAKDNSSYMTIQGFTAAGCFVDEAALCKRSAVEQALARCSVDGSKFWFNCNPESPRHWFYKEWIQQAEQKNALYLHFELRDNPSLTQRIIERYERQYTGVFYKRYILGMWVAAEGIIYPMFDGCKEPTFKGDMVEGRWDDKYRYCISLDYGTQNAFAALKWVEWQGVWHCVGEYRYSGRDTGHQKTNGDYLADMIEFTKDAPLGEKVEVIIDPSATSFKAELRRSGMFKVKDAVNDVVEGIRRTGTCLQNGYVKISEECVETFNEFGGYAWDETEYSDKPIKVNDHLMDALRYLVNTKRVYKKEDRYVSLFERRAK